MIKYFLPTGIYYRQNATGTDICPYRLVGKNGCLVDLFWALLEFHSTFVSDLDI